MKLQFHPKDGPIIQTFLAGWVQSSDHLALLSLEESDPIYFDCDAAELQNCFMELEKKGFAESAKAIFQGNHFYRSDTGKCLRCWRYRPEIHWNNENLLKSELCDRCREIK